MRTPIGLLKEELAKLQTASDDLETIIGLMQGQRDALARAMETVRADILVEEAEGRSDEIVLATINLQEVV